MVFVIFTEDLQKDTSLSTFFSRFLPMAAEYCDFDSRSLPGQVVFTNLLRGTEVSEEAKTRFLLRLGQSDEYRLCLVRNLTVRNYTQRSLLINELNTSTLPVAACEFNKDVIILLAVDHLRNLIRLLEQKVSFSSAILGASVPMHDISLLPAAYAQAVFASDAEKTPGIRFCEELALPYLLRELRKNSLTFYLLHPAIKKLDDYDKKNGTELIKTLQAILSCRGSLTQAAEQLHVHLNTIKYRMGRIKEMTRIDLDNSEERFYLELSLKIDTY